MPRSAQWLLGTMLVVLVIGGPFGYARYRKATFRNFHIVQSGVLYRSGQLSRDALVRAIHDYGLKTVITLRDPKTPGNLQPDQDEADFCCKEELYYYRLPHRVLARVRSPWIRIDGK